jgi:hypothetical protein
VRQGTGSSEVSTTAKVHMLTHGATQCKEANCVRPARTECIDHGEGWCDEHCKACPNYDSGKCIAAMHHKVKCICEEGTTVPKGAMSV